jgi:phosphatidylglycerol---prolipoprotein diacylglyceryl transferase
MIPGGSSFLREDAMLPTVFTIPLPGGGGIPIKGYGLMLMLGFLSAIWLCMRRAEKVRSNPDTVLNAGFLALICGVFGARLFYVVHYWGTQYRDMFYAQLRARGILSAVWVVFDVTSGGLEFYGGFIAAVAAIIFYLSVKKYSVRLFLDIMAPSVMWGLAFGRMGCFLNGCCFGGTCPTHIPWPMAVTFPYASPAHMHHLQTNRAALPREFLYMDGYGMVRPIAREHIAMRPDEILGPKKKYREARQAFEVALSKASPAVAESVNKILPRFEDQRRAIQQAMVSRMSQEQAQEYRQGYLRVRKELFDACQAAANGPQLIKLIQVEEQAWAKSEEQAMNLRDLLGDARNPRPELKDIEAFQEKAQQFRSHKVYPAQLLGVANALFLSGILSLFFYRRRVHGAVFGLMLVLKPITRFVLEWIRADNPIDSGGLTISQAISLGVLLPLGLIILLVVYKFLPPQSPHAGIWLPPRKDPPPPGEGSSSRTATDEGRPQSEPRPKPRKSLVETVVVTPDDLAEAADQDWFETEAICAKCGTALRPPEGLMYQHRASKRGPGADKTPGVVEIAGSDPSTSLELICEACFDRRPPQDKTRAKRLARKWWKTGQL